MSNLVWSIAFGSYKRLSDMWLKSLVHIGGWRGDVIILTDEDGIQDLRGAKIRRVDVRALCRVEPSVSYNSTKALIQFIDGVWDYDYLLYNDCDVLVTSNRFKGIIEKLATDAQIAVQRGTFSVASQRPWTGWNELTKEEREIFGHVAINAGIVGVPSSELGRRLLRDWHAANIAGGFQGNDQVRLVTLLLRQYQGLWQHVPEAASYGTSQAEGAAIVHYNGGLHGPMEERFASLGIP